MLQYLDIPNYIKEFISKSLNKINGLHSVKMKNNLTQEVKNWFEENQLTPVQVKYLIDNNLNEIPKCKTCGKILSDFRNQFCSRKCANNYIEHNISRGIKISQLKNNLSEECRKEIANKRLETIKNNPENFLNGIEKSRIKNKETWKKKPDEEIEAIVQKRKNTIAQKPQEEINEWNRKISNSLKSFTQDKRNEINEKIRNTFLNKSEEEIQKWKNTLSIASKQYWNNLSDEEKQHISELRKEIWANKTEEEKNQKIEKYKQTCQEKYGKGIINLFQTEEIKEKIKQTCLIKYGVEYYSQSDEYKEKLHKICQEKYNCNWTGQIDTKKENTEKSNLKRYGSVYPHYTTLYKLDNFTFDSSWEVVFYIYYRDKGCNIKRNDITFSYIANSKKHKTYVDFTIDNVLYEVKSSFIINSQQEKIQMLKENNVNIISDNEIKKYFDYVNEKYGKDYIKQFRIK